MQVIYYRNVGIISVSYTHLDVYKRQDVYGRLRDAVIRQALWFPCFLQRWCFCFRMCLPGCWSAVRTAPLWKWQAQPWLLDVYKRQALPGACSSGMHFPSGSGFHLYLHQNLSLIHILKHLERVGRNKFCHKKAQRRQHNYHDGNDHVPGEHKNQCSDNGDNAGKQLGEAHEKPVWKNICICSYPADNISCTVAVKVRKRQLLDMADGLCPDILHLSLIHIFPTYAGDSVLIDNFQAGYFACMHLIELGHKHIGFIKGPGVSSASSQRFACLLYTSIYTCSVIRIKLVIMPQKCKIIFCNSEIHTAKRNSSVYARRCV